MAGKLFMLPSPIGENSLHQLSAHLMSLYRTINHFAVENIKTTRRLMKAIDQQIDIDTLTFYQLDKNTAVSNLHPILKSLLDGNDVAIVSEAGCPGIADPGNVLVKLAHEKSIEVIPVTGPSSVFLALMASGLNGQQFCFHGYLPIPRKQLEIQIKNLASQAKTGVTQIFIETPYRNEKLYQLLIQILPGKLRLCIARQVATPYSFIQTHTIDTWKNRTAPDLHKKETVFLIG